MTLCILGVWNLGSSLLWKVEGLGSICIFELGM